MTEELPILCVGAALWDIIARAESPMNPGSDFPGRILRQPGGVALNIARAIRAAGPDVTLLSAVGQDADGQSLLGQMTDEGIDCGHVTRMTRPTDVYVAIEGPAGDVFGAVADCLGLEHAGDLILAPLLDGRLGDAATPWAGKIIVDGNLPEPVLAQLADHPAFSRADLAFVPASPGKAHRLRAVLGRTHGAIYVNRGEAETLCNAGFTRAEDAARALLDLGATRAIVTDGPNPAALASASTVITATPPRIETRTLTGAGDAFLAGHVAAERAGLPPQAALDAAVSASTRHIAA